MARELEFVARSVLIGGGATVVMDLWLLLLRRGLGVRTLDHAMLGRWLGHMPRGTFAHASIAKAAPVRGERALGLDWARSPSLPPALIVGLATVAAPLFVLQPALGAGFASWRMPDPNAARLRSVLTHAVYGLGLYAAARVWAALLP